MNCKVLILNAEDGVEDTIRPRLEKLGADLKNVFAFKQVITLDEKGLGLLEEHLRTLRPVLVVIDPIVAFMGAARDMHRANEVREFMSALATLAERYSCAILVVRHLNKSVGASVMNRGMGSIDIIAASRSALLLGRDPMHPDQCAVMHFKSNVAQKGHSLGYTVKDGHFNWTGKSDLTPEQVLAPPNEGNNPSLISEAKEFLIEVLSQGELPVGELHSLSNNAGIAQRTLERAKKELKVQSRRVGITGGGKGAAEYFWSLPTEVPLARQTSQTENLADKIPGEKGEP